MVLHTDKLDRHIPVLVELMFQSRRTDTKQITQQTREIGSGWVLGRK